MGDLDSRVLDYDFLRVDIHYSPIRAEFLITDNPEKFNLTALRFKDRGRPLLFYDQPDVAIWRGGRLGDGERNRIREKLGVARAADLYSQAARCPDGIGRHPRLDLTLAHEYRRKVTAIEVNLCVLWNLDAIELQVEISRPRNYTRRIDRVERDRRWNRCGSRRWRLHRRRRCRRRIDKNISPAAARGRGSVRQRSQIERL